LLAGKPYFHLDVLISLSDGSGAVRQRSQARNAHVSKEGVKTIVPRSLQNRRDYPNPTKQVLAQRLSKRLANFKLKDDVITRLAERVLIDGLEIKRLDPCIYGICIDYFTDKPPKLDGILSKFDIARIEVFPYGIIEWDRFLVRVGYSVDEMERVV
jgi:hypothetical protein